MKKDKKEKQTNNHSPFFEKNVFPKEWDYIKIRRKNLQNTQTNTYQNSDETPPPPITNPPIPLKEKPQCPTTSNSELVGLALSGGGIRSSTFNLGIVQNLLEKNYFKYFDYMSTVSGGGYIGSCISTLLSNKKGKEEKDGYWELAKNFVSNLFNKNEDQKEENLFKKIPFRHNLGQPESNAFRHLRNFSNYLAPKGWVDMIRFPALIFRGIIINILIIVPYLFFAAIFTTYSSGDRIYKSYINTFTPQKIAAKNISKSLDRMPEAEKIIISPETNKAQLESKELNDFEVSEKVQKKLGESEKNYKIKLSESMGNSTRRIQIYKCDGAKCDNNNSNVSGIRLIGDPIDLSANQWNFMPPKNHFILTKYAGIFFLLIIIFYPLIQLFENPNLSSNEKYRTLLARTLAFIFIFGFMEIQPRAVYYYSAFIYKLKNGTFINHDFISATFATLSAVGAAFFSGTGISKKSNLIEKLKLYLIGLLGFLSIWIMYLAICRHILFKIHDWSNLYSNNFFKTLFSWWESSIIKILDVLGFVLNWSFLRVTSTLEAIIQTVLSFLGINVKWNFIKPSSWGEIALPAQLKGLVPSPEQINSDLFIYFLIAFIMLICTRFFVDINKHSINRFYRDSLSKAFLFTIDPKNTQKILPCDRLKLSELGGTSEEWTAPYHLINTALNVPNSKNVNIIRGRNTDFFIFSKHFIGGELTNYYKTEEFDNEDIDPYIDLGSAMSISAAAASPNAGTTTIKPLVFFMALLNIRLGYWLPNPKEVQKFSKLKRFFLYFIYFRPPMSKGPSPRYLIREMFSKFDENLPYINLSDGGHIENLGGYELLRRRCKYIVIGDGEADPDLKFEGLAILMRLARIDMGINIDINVEHIEKNKGTDLSQGHWTVGTIKYGDGEIGKLLYLKLSVTGDENRYIKEYGARKEGSDFPHQSTADQFFDETQFEAYRALGHHVGKQLFPENQEITELKNKKLDLEKEINTIEKNEEKTSKEQDLEEVVSRIDLINEVINGNAEKWFNYLTEKDNKNKDKFKKEREEFEKKTAS
jgi:hypothetical protein